MIVECPKCAKDKEIEFAKNIICDECKSSFFGYRFRKHKRKLISATTALLIGTAGGYKAGDFFTEERYPLAVEYQLVSACVSSDNRALQRNSYVQKQQTCLCAVQETTSNLSYSEFRGSASFIIKNIFESNIARCR